MIEIVIGSLTMSVLWKGLKPAFQYSSYCQALGAENFLKEINGINCVIRPKKIDSDASRKPWQQRLLPQTDGNMTCF